MQTVEMKFINALKASKGEEDNKWGEKEKKVGKSRLMWLNEFVKDVKMLGAGCAAMNREGWGKLWNKPKLGRWVVALDKYVTVCERERVPVRTRQRELNGDGTKNPLALQRCLESIRERIMVCIRRFSNPPRRVRKKKKLLY